jgi:hypothetical protein
VLGRLGQWHLDDSVKFVAAHDMLPGLEMAGGIPRTRGRAEADGGGPCAAGHALARRLSLFSRIFCSAIRRRCLSRFAIAGPRILPYSSHRSH